MRRVGEIQVRRDRPVTGKTVLLCLAAFFGTVIGVNAVMVVAAISTFGGVETANAYQAGLAFTREVLAARAQDARAWDVRATLSPSDRGETAVKIAVHDRTGEPLAGLQAAAHFIHPTDRRGDVVLELQEQAPGTYGALATVSAGQWYLLIELSRAGERQFRSRNRVILR